MTDLLENGEIRYIVCWSFFEYTIVLKDVTQEISKRKEYSYNELISDCIKATKIWTCFSTIEAIDFRVVDT